MAGAGGNTALMAVRGLLKHNDLLVAALIIGIVLIIVIPVPPGILDLLLTFSITFSLIILLTTMFTTEPLQFSVFPSLLLVVTLYRLALNISSTRLILNEAHAGKVIEAFGSFVVGGSYVVGILVFLIITVIQFIVITNGAGRVAEVAARFTLDAMPGKQMSIDADLSGGLIGEREARERRKNLQREADFFGSMDGASKFVRGDAIAGIVIILINIAGGFLIGIWQHGMSFMEAAQTYTLLTVGDGLVTQIPALLVSTATGILVTRAGSQGTFGGELSLQITSFPRVIALASGILFLIGLIPGLPTIPFFILAAGCGYAAYVLFQEARKKKAAETEKLREESQQQRQPENVLDLFQTDPLEIEIGYNLIILTDEDQGGDLLERLVAVRRRCAADLGIFVRPIRIRDNLQLPANTYAFKIRGVEAVRGEIFPGQFLAMDPFDQEVELEGKQTREPTFGLPAWWISEKDKEDVELKGLTVVDSATVLITHLTEFIKQHAYELLGRQEVKEMLETVKEKNPAVVEELVPNLLSLGEIQKVLQNLLKEQLPIKDLVTILESLADGARITKELDFLTENCRRALYRTISKLYAGEQQQLSVMTLHPSLEQTIADSLQATQEGNFPILPPETTETILEKIKQEAEKMSARGLVPIILCSSRVRLPLKRLTERFLPQLVVLSINELDTVLEVDSIAVVNLN